VIYLKESCHSLHCRLAWSCEAGAQLISAYHITFGPAASSRSVVEPIQASPYASMYGLALIERPALLVVWCEVEMMLLGAS
jgi:hypothetical protein